MSYAYSVFGLAVRSNAPISGLPSSKPLAAPTDIQLHFGHSPEIPHASSTLTESLVYSSPYKTLAGASALQIWRTAAGLFHLAYFDGTEFWMDRHGTELWATWPSHSSAEEASTYLLGPVLGLLLRFRGVTCLHASAVAIDGSTIAFVGPEGAGKSTTAAAFARAGYAVVSDDVVALVEREGEFHVSPAYPHVWLWPESLDILYGSSYAVPPLIPNWEKRRLPLGDGELLFEEATLPLRAVYLLADDRDQPDAPIEPVAAQAGFLSLIANSYATSMLDTDMRASEFKTLAGLISKVPVRHFFTSKGQLPAQDLCSFVLKDLAALKCVH